MALRMRIPFPRLLLLLVLSTVTGCATHADRLVSIRNAYYSGRVDKADQIVATNLKEKDGETDVLKLEQSMIAITDGRPQDAERILREVRDSFDYFEKKDIGETVLSTFTDDNKISYAGEDYEKVLIRCFLALSNLMQGGDDARAYALQVGDKQQQIINSGKDEETGDNPKLSYNKVALGAYINAAIQEATQINYDEAARSIQLVANWEPSFRYAKQDLDRVTNGVHSKKGNGVLYVFTLVGKGPYKEERPEIPSSQALLIADRIISATSKHSVPPTLAAIKVPVVVRSKNDITNVSVTINDDEFGGMTQTLTDVGRMAVDQYAAIFPSVMARAVVRRVTKKTAIYGLKEATDVENPIAELALDAVGSAWEATESADTRCWGLLPDKIQVLRLELPAGEHRIELAPVAGKRAIGSGVKHTLIVEDGRNTYLMANFPSSKMIGQVVVSNPGQY
jgi:uncharacterized protein